MEQVAVERLSEEAQIEQLRKLQAELETKLQAAIASRRSTDVVAQAHREYERTVGELLGLMGVDAPCSIVDIFAWKTFSRLYFLRTGKAPDSDYPPRIIHMMLHTSK